MRNHIKFKSEYAALVNAKSRCFNPNVPSYADYGGRGITVHPDWCGLGGFAKFIEHIGPKPSPKLTLERIDNERSYEPGNVRWATIKEQMLNRRTWAGKRTIHYTVKRYGLRNADIKAARASGEKVGDVAKRFDLSTAMVYRICKRP